MVIHDRSYARWTGDRNRPSLATAAIFRTGLRRCVAILFRRKIPAVGLLLGAYGVAVFALGALIVKHYALMNADAFPPEFSEALRDPEFNQIFSANPDSVWVYMITMQSAFVAIACVLLGAGLIAEDRRNNALELYFSRSVSVRQYLVGKLATIGALIAAVTVVPTALLVLFDASMSAGDPALLGTKAALLGRTVLAGSVLILIPSLFILAASSLTLRARNAAILFLAVVIMLEFVVSNILIEIFTSSAWNLLKPAFNIGQVAAWMLGSDENLDLSVPVWQSAVVLAVWVAVLVPLLVRRVRPVEVVA